MAHKEKHIPIKAVGANKPEKQQKEKHKAGLFLHPSQPWTRWHATKPQDNGHGQGLPRSTFSTTTQGPQTEGDNVCVYAVEDLPMCHHTTARGRMSASACTPAGEVMGLASVGIAVF